MNHVPLLLGRFLIKGRWITAAQLNRAILFQREQQLGLAAITLLEGLLAVDEVRCILAHQQQTGQLFAEAGQDLALLDRARLAHLEARRGATRLLLGEILVLQGSLSAAELVDAIAAYNHYTTTGILTPYPQRPDAQSAEMEVACLANGPLEDA